MSVVLAGVAFGTAFAVFAVLALLLAVSWHGRRAGALLIVAVAMTACWAGIVAVEPHVSSIGFSSVVVAELLRDGAWLVFLTVLLREARLRLLAVSVWTIWGLALAVALAVAGSERLGSIVPIEEVLVLAGIVLSIVGLVFLEQLYRIVHRGYQQQAIKYLIAGLALVLAYDLFAYSQALLLGEIQQSSWIARGFIAAIAGPVIAVSARRHKPWTVQLYISRDATFFGTAACAVGVYLALMASIGFAIRLQGGEWAVLAQTVFMVAAGVGLVLLVASPGPRRTLKVLLSKHFYRSRYDYRTEWLRFAESLAAPEGKEELHAAAVQSVARIVEAPSGLLWTEDAGGETYEAVCSWPNAAHPLLRVQKTEPLIAFIRRTKWIVDVNQHRLAPEAYDHTPLPTAWDGGTVRIAVPLFLRDELQGFVTLAGRGIREKLDYEDHDLLKTVGSQIATYLKQDEIQRQLLVSQQFEAYHRLAAFMLHDLKNIIAQQNLVLRNAERHRTNPAFIDDALSTISHSLDRMNRMLGQFRVREQGAVRRVSLRDILQESLRACSRNRPEPVVRESGPDAYLLCEPGSFSAALEHLIRNAQQATRRDGTVTVSATVANGKAFITIEDDGVGMDPDFIRNRLFSPFDTTKGAQGMGIGAYQARETIRAIGGRVTVESRPGEGSIFRIELPVSFDEQRVDARDTA